MSDALAIPSSNSLRPFGNGGQRVSRVSRHRLSTTPPRENFQPDEEYITESDEEDEYLNDSTVQLLFNKIYVDPLQDEFESIDGEAGSILRTGKFSVAGETGSMDLLQPLLFSLQATQDDLTLLLPQLMQSPFFNPSQRQQELFSYEPSIILSEARIRLGVKVDAVIYELLSSFCTKGPGSKQADALINCALRTSYKLPTQSQTFKFKCQNSPPLFLNGYIMARSPLPNSSDSDEEPTTGSMDPPIMTKNRSRSSIASTSSGFGSSTRDQEEYPAEYTKSPTIAELKRSSSTSINRSLERHQRTSSIGRERKESVAMMFPWTATGPSSGRTRKDSDNSVTSSIASSILGGGDNNWQVEIESPANDMIIGRYSDNTYSILMWNPRFKVEFEIGSEEDGMCTTTYCVDPNKPSVGLQIRNSNDVPIAFSIRAHRQSLMFRSHVIFPRDGLNYLEAHEEFCQEFDVIGSEGIKRDEHIIIDLFVCKLHGEPSWNIQRRYVILKCDEDKGYSQENHEQRLLKKLFDGGYPLQPGLHKDLATTLKQVILHGLQCVVKNKIEEAEIIFTQALHLPLFQRVTLKAFAYICLAVIADKRRKRSNVHKVNHIFSLVRRLDELLDACDSATAAQLQMPKTIALIKQLKKELNFTKIVETLKKDTSSSMTRRVIDETSVVVTSSGDMVSLDETRLMIPGGSLSQETKVTLSNMSKTEIHQALQNSPWASMLSVIAAFSITCSPPVSRFITPVIATITLPHNSQLKQHTPLRLMQSKFMNNWTDITNDPSTQVTLDANVLTVRTDHTGWILVASINLDMSQIMQIAMKSVFTEEPVTMQVNVFGRKVVNDDVSENVEVTAFFTPATKDDSLQNQKKDPPTPEHKTISFPHSFKASKGQRLRLEVHNDYQQTEICNENIIVDTQLESIVTKDIALTNGNSPPSSRKLVITKYCNVHDKWEGVVEIRLSLNNISNANTSPSLNSP